MDDDAGALAIGGLILSDDHLAWERQPGESESDYAMFSVYRDSEKRRVEMFNEDSYKERGWSKDIAADLFEQWGWSYRAWQWDRWQRATEAEERARYRRSMDERQRATARIAQQKVAQWIMQMDPTRLTAGEASKLLEVAAKLERAASADPIVAAPLLDVDLAVEDDLNQISPGAR